MLRSLAFALALALPLAAYGPSAHAMGSGTTAPANMVNPDYVAAEKLIKEWKYAEAIPLLEKVVKADAKNADAFNQLGYANRKLNKLPEARAHYAKALEINPEHKGALEYQGEMFLMLDDLKAAEGNLAKLDKLCFFGCTEFSELKKAITEYKQRKGITS
ncbi:MAG: tetratricopeptide repeat protein [Alphaproteobacteria bacterium]|nr:tetratricopeptide repeat protein [Alphaproteobacteria bacterium]